MLHFSLDTTPPRKTHLEATGPYNFSLQPLELKVEVIDGKETILILWSDMHRSRYEPFKLRSSCPCAACQGEPGIFGRRYDAPKTLIGEDVSPKEIEPVGRYGLKVTWSDSHNLGIYTFEYLRKLCQCQECQEIRD
jgi:DUF971 family protein